MKLINFILIILMLAVGVPAGSSTTMGEQGITLSTITDKTNMTLSMFDTSGDSKYEIVEFQMEFDVLAINRIYLNLNISNSTHKLYNENYDFDPSNTGKQLYNFTMFGWEFWGFDTVGELTIIMGVRTAFDDYPDIIKVMPFDSNDYVETPITWGETRIDMLDVIDTSSNPVPDGKYEMLMISKKMNVSVPGHVKFTSNIDGMGHWDREDYDIGNYDLNANFTIEKILAETRGESIFYSAIIEIQGYISYGAKEIYFAYWSGVDSVNSYLLEGRNLGSRLIETEVSHQLIDGDGDGLTDGIDITMSINSRLNGNISGAIEVKMKDTYYYPPIRHDIEDVLIPGENNFTMYVSLRDLRTELWSGEIAVGSWAGFDLDYGVTYRMDKYFDIIYDPDILDDLGARVEKVEVLPLGNPINAFNVSTTVEMLTAGKISLTYEAELNMGGDLLEWAFSSLRDFEPGFHTIFEIFSVPALIKSDAVFSLNITGRFTYPTGEGFTFDVLGIVEDIIVDIPITDPTSEPTSDPTKTTDTSGTNTQGNPSTEQSTPTAPVPFWFSIVPIIIPVAIKKRKNIE